MDTDKVVIIHGEKHFKLEPGDEVKSGDLYESSSGRYEDPPLTTGMEVPGEHVNYYRPARNVEVEVGNV